MVEVREQKAKDYYDMFAGVSLDELEGSSSDGSAAGMDSDGMPVYYQNDFQNPLGNVTIAIGGCGPTSFAMVASAITGRNISPVETSAWCEQHGFYVNGQGTSHAYLEAISGAYGINCEYLGEKGVTASLDTKVWNALKSGKYVISLQGPGLFTTGGHYIVLKNINSDGTTITVRDPNKDNTDYNSRKFSMAEIHASAKKYWAFSK